MNVLDQILQEQKTQRALISSVLEELQKPVIEDKYLSVKEFSETLGIHEQSTRNAIKEGRIEAKRLGRRVFIHNSQLEKGLLTFKSLKHKR